MFLMTTITTLLQDMIFFFALFYFIASTALILPLLSMTHLLQEYRTLLSIICVLLASEIVLYITTYIHQIYKIPWGLAMGTTKHDLLKISTSSLLPCGATLIGFYTLLFSVSIAYAISKKKNTEQG